MAAIIARILVAVGYAIVSYWVLSDLAKARRSLDEFSSRGGAFWLLVIVTLAPAITFVAYMLWLLPPAIYYPIPWVLLVFAPAIIAAKVLVRHYEVQGTARVAPAEDACSKVHWFAILGAAVMFINLLLLWVGILGAR